MAAPGTTPDARDPTDRWGPVDPGLALPLLERVEGLAHGMAGAFVLGDERHPTGMVFVQDGSICWAVSERMRGRLTDLLLERGSESVAREAVEALYLECKRAGMPLGEALVEAEMIGPDGLRDALRRHTCEALLNLGPSLGCATKWVPHERPSYDAAFTFRPVEVYAHLGAMQSPTESAACAEALALTLPPGCPGVACARDGGGTAIALLNGEGLRVTELHELCRWLGGPVDIAAAIDERYRIVSLMSATGALAAWKMGGAILAALCRDASELAFVTSKRAR